MRLKLELCLDGGTRCVCVCVFVYICMPLFELFKHFFLLCFFSFFYRPKKIKLRLIFLLLVSSEDEAAAAAAAAAVGGAGQGQGGQGGAATQRRPTDLVLETLAGLEKDNHHVTESYFWLQMLSYHLAVVKKEQVAVAVAAGSTTPSRTSALRLLTPITFDDFFRRPLCQPLRNSMLIDKYYSRHAIDAPEAKTAFTLPDIKQLPNRV